ncbi:cysteine proteinase inhibitor 5-like [Bidens hawaiensis]|uniref:cysteine proteinase inhibitor 5-like n=1 Tax=Bidens hawaiensis TaxID=980011 RepID=UPI00404B872B
MSLRCHNLLLVVLFLVSVFNNVSLALGDKTLDDGWSPISPSDPYMVTIAQFAVKEHDSGHPYHLVFDSLIGGKTKHDQWRIYILTLLAKDADRGDNVGKYIARVEDRPYQNYLVLVDFRGPI